MEDLIAVDGLRSPGETEETMDVASGDLIDVEWSWVYSCFEGHFL